MSTIQEGDYLIVSKDGTNYKLKVENINLVEWDCLVVTQNGVDYKLSDVMITAESSDYVVVHRNGVNYRSTVLNLRDYINNIKPWDSHNGGIFHVKNASETITLHNTSSQPSAFTAWDADGTNERTISSFGVGDDIVILCPANATFLFRQNFTGTWDFGQYTNTSKTTSTMSMLEDCREFNGVMGGTWDLRNGDVKSMFSNAHQFNQEIDHFDVYGIQSFDKMFFQARKFDKDISSWDVSLATVFTQMFESALVFNQNIGGWEVGNVLTMLSMFSSARAFNQDIGDWDVSSVGNMLSMFRGAQAFNQDIGDWDVSNNTTMQNMFDNAQAFNQDIGDWDVSSVGNMSSAFQGASSFNKDIGGWDTSSATKMYYMFKNATRFSQDLSEWCVSNLEFYQGSQEPLEFYLNSGLTSPQLPVWGTCPRGEDGN